MTPFRFALVVVLAVNCGEVLADSVNPSRQLFRGLPLDLAIKEVRGNGLRTFAAFEDPNCPHSRRLAVETADITDVTIYTFPYPILSTASRKAAEAIWCAPEPSKAWKAWMIHQTAPKGSVCDTGAIDKIITLGKTMKIRSVPTIFLANGERYAGEKSRIELEMAISSPKVLGFQAELKKDRIGQ